MMTIFVGKTPWLKNNESPLGSGTNPIPTVQEAIKSGATGIVIFANTDFDDRSILVGNDFKPHKLSFHAD